MDADVTETTGRYLSAVLLVSEREGRPAKTGEVAEHLDVTPASVTERLEHLDECGLVEREKYTGTTLTETGEAVTRELMWKHCLAGNFLASDLDVEHADAFGVGNALSDEAALALQSLIDHPCTSTCRAPEAEYDACRGDVRGPEA